MDATTKNCIRDWLANIQNEIADVAEAIDKDDLPKMEELANRNKDGELLKSLKRALAMVTRSSSPCSTHILSQIKRIHDLVTTMNDCLDVNIRKSFYPGSEFAMLAVEAVRASYWLEHATALDYSGQDSGSDPAPSPNQQPTTTRVIVSPQEMRAVMGISQDTLRKYIRQGALPVEQISSKSYSMSAEDWEQLKARQSQKPKV